MKLNLAIKYLLRFLLLQASLTFITIYYFDSFLISNADFKQNIYINLVEDSNRFIPWLSKDLITVDAFFVVMVFIFLIILYSTKFYTYVNELLIQLIKTCSMNIFNFIFFGQVIYLLCFIYLDLKTFLEATYLFFHYLFL